MLVAAGRCLAFVIAPYGVDDRVLGLTVVLMALGWTARAVWALRCAGGRRRRPRSIPAVGPGLRAPLIGSSARWATSQPDGADGSSRDAPGDATEPPIREVDAWAVVSYLLSGVLL